MLDVHEKKISDEIFRLLDLEVDFKKPLPVQKDFCGGGVGEA